MSTTKYVLLMFVVFFVCATTKAQHGNGDTLQLQKTVTDFFNALSELDTAKAKSFCTKDIDILETGQLWNFDSLALRINTRKSLSPDFKRINTLHFIQSKINGNTGWVYYFSKAEMSFDGQSKTVNWLESVILIKEANTWKINLLHSTSLDTKK